MNLRKALESAADRMIGRIVPRATASADQYECSTQHRCTFKLGCWASHGLDTYQTRTYCSDGSSTAWKDLGCC